jgi:multicomponent Na+:H+ antiporter subunit F
MTLVWLAVYSMLTAGAALSMVRVWLGPSLLDRVIATETLLAIITVGIAAYAALARDSAVVPVLLVVALLGFIASVSVARYVGGMLVMSPDDAGQGVGLPPAAEQSTEGR